MSRRHASGQVNASTMRSTYLRFSCYFFIVFIILCFKPFSLSRVSRKKPQQSGYLMRSSPLLCNRRRSSPPGGLLLPSVDSHLQQHTFTSSRTYRCPSLSLSFTVGKRKSDAGLSSLSDGLCRREISFPAIDSQRRKCFPQTRYLCLSLSLSLPDCNRVAAVVF